MTLRFCARRSVIAEHMLPSAFIDAYARLAAAADKRHAGYITLALSLPRKPRTTGPGSQNSHSWGHAQQIAEHTGHEVDEVMAVAKHRAVKRGYPVEEIAGVMVPWSQARISTVECGYLIDELHQIAAELDITLVESEDA